jgi:hypothetical protein
MGPGDLAFEISPELMFDPLDFVTHLFGDDVLVLVSPDAFADANVLGVEFALLPS